MTNGLLLLDLLCPNCNHSLTHGTQITLIAVQGDTHREGEVRLSAYFGDYTVETELNIPIGVTVEFRCPVCDQSLMLDARCRLCGAHVASLNLRDGGYVEFCSRRGCRGHALGGSGDIDAMIGLVNRMMKTPHD